MGTDPGFRSSLQIFPSASIEATRSFYEGIGFRAESHLDGARPHVCLYRDAIEIVLTRSALERIVPNREAHGYGYDAYFISGDQEVLHEELRRKGAKIVREPDITDYSNREFVFEDNERRWIAVGRKEGSDSAQDLRLHHVAFICRDIAAMERFYAEALGFRRVRTFKAGTPEEFFIMRRDGARVELFPLKADAAADSARFKHVALRVESLDNATRRLARFGVPADRVIDYTAGDRVFKVGFFRDPEGNVIEFMEGEAEGTGPA